MNTFAILLGINGGRQRSIPIERALDGDGLTAWIEVRLVVGAGCDVDLITIIGGINRNLNGGVVRWHVDGVTNRWSRQATGSQRLHR